MIFLITPTNRDRYGRELDQIFRLRHDVLVEVLKWKGLRASDGREIDDFDNDDAFYIGAHDSDGEVVGCMRLNPTTSRTLTASAFTHLVQFRDLPISPQAFDITRYVVSRQTRGSLREKTCACDLICGLYEFGLSQNLAAYTAVLSTELFSSLLQIGIVIDALGFPARVEDQDCLAVSLPVCSQSLEASYRASRNFQPRLISVGMDSAGAGVMRPRSGNTPASPVALA